MEIMGSNQFGIREHNERLVLTIVRNQGPLAKSEIARKTGLSVQTTSVIMRALEQDGFLEKCEKIRGKVGQPSIPMRLRAGGAYFLGLKVGRRSIQLVLVNFIGEIICEKTQTYKYPTPDSTLSFAKSALQDVLSSLTVEQRKRISGLGIAAPYFLWEWASVIGVDESKMAAWKDCDLAGEISKFVDFPVYLGNDATCACGAELVFGNPEDAQDFLYLYMGYFIGGGVVLNGKLYPGTLGNAGAIGPMPVGGLDNTQQLVDLASIAGLEKQLDAQGYSANVLWDDTEHWDIDQHELDLWVDNIVPTLCHTIISAVSIIDFSNVIIDGSMPRHLVDQIVTNVGTHLSERKITGLLLPKVTQGQMGGKARALGAASLPLSKKFLLET